MSKVHVCNLNNLSFCIAGDIPLPTAWTELLTQVPVKDFTSTTGPTVNIPQSPLEVFKLFFLDDLLDSIVEESNRYAAQVMGDERYREWTKVKAFFGFSILMGIEKLPSVDDYWSKDPLLHYPPIADRIPRWRFREISRYLHFVDNDAPRGDPAHDRLGKVRPLVDHLGSKFEALDEPSKHVAVDEAMIKFQGRSSLKQYMRSSAGSKCGYWEIVPTGTSAGSTSTPARRKIVK